MYDYPSQVTHVFGVVLKTGLDPKSHCPGGFPFATAQTGLRSHAIANRSHTQIFTTQKGLSFFGSFRLFVLLRSTMIWVVAVLAFLFFGFSNSPKKGKTYLPVFQAWFGLLVFWPLFLFLQPPKKSGFWFFLPFFLFCFWVSPFLVSPLFGFSSFCFSLFCFSLILCLAFLFGFSNSPTKSGFWPFLPFVPLLFLGFSLFGFSSFFLNPCLFLAFLFGFSNLPQRAAFGSFLPFSPFCFWVSTFLVSPLFVSPFFVSCLFVWFLQPPTKSGFWFFLAFFPFLFLGFPLFGFSSFCFSLFCFLPFCLVSPTSHKERLLFFCFLPFFPLFFWGGMSRTPATRGSARASQA